MSLSKECTKALVGSVEDLLHHFAYREDDAVLTCVNLIFKHLVVPGTLARLPVNPVDVETYRRISKTSELLAALEEKPEDHQSN